MRRFVRSRWLWRSRPVRTWITLAVLAAVALTTWARAWGEARQQARRWGDTAPAVVAASDVAAGQPIGPALRLERRPIAHLPDAALAAAPPPAWVAVHDLASGTVLTSDDVVDPAGSPSRPGIGEVALAAPFDVRTPALQVGDVVLLIDTSTTTATAPSWPGRVLSVDERVVEVALAAQDAVRAAVALQRGALVVTLSASPLPPPPE